MKRIFITSVLIVSVNFYSCKEDFNPKTEFSEKYVLYGIIVNSPPLEPNVSVAILKTFDTQGYNPMIDHKDHSLKGCTVILQVKDKEFVLDPVKKDSIENFAPEFSYRKGNLSFNPHMDYFLKAMLPDGTILTSHTRVPQMISMHFSYPFNTGIHSRIDRFAWGDTWNIDLYSYYGGLYFPKLTLNYLKKTESVPEYHSSEIPLKYVKKDGKYQPVFPSYSWDGHYEYSLDCFDSVMMQISAGDSLKENYVITGATLTIIEFEKNLASFYSSTNGYLDNFSIRLDESVYSNVTGGIGVFGAITYTTQKFDVNKLYVESFGYKYD